MRIWLLAGFGSKMGKFALRYSSSCSKLRSREKAVHYQRDSAPSSTSTSANVARETARIRPSLEWRSTMNTVHWLRIVIWIYAEAPILSILNNPREQGARF